MLIRWLFRKIFKRNASTPVVSYLPPVMGILICYMNLSQHRYGDAVVNIVSLSVLSIIILVAITVNLRHFVLILQKPYHSANLHIALGSVFATVILFAAIYSVIYLYVPDSFVGLSGNTPLDECVNVVYFSATTFTTVGFGDIHPVATIARLFTIIEMMAFFVFFVVLLGNHRVFIKPKNTEPQQNENELKGEQNTELQQNEN